MSIEYTTTDHIATLRLNRPERFNALDLETMELLGKTLVRFRDDPDAWVLIITGAGDKAFCAGADLTGTTPPAEPFACSLLGGGPVSDAMYIRHMQISRLNITKPMIAAINGHAFGGGMEIALGCDLRIASSNATFALSEVRVGTIPALGGIQWLVRALPTAVAMKMLLTGERIDAAEAKRVGFVSDVYEPGKLMDAAQDLAAKICANAPLAVRAVKYLATRGWNMSFDEAVSTEELLWGILRNTHDRIEGRAAFTERRPPKYEGR
jgi:E-phenylitaconyl-CoA hydratase